MNTNYNPFDDPSFDPFANLRTPVFSEETARADPALTKKPTPSKKESEKVWKENFEKTDKVSNFSKESFEKIEKYIAEHESSWAKEVQETGKAKYIRSPNLPRSLLYTPDGKIFVLFNKQKEGDKVLFGKKNEDGTRSRDKVIKLAWEWGTNQWFGSTSVTSKELLEQIKQGYQLVKDVEGCFPLNYLVEYIGKGDKNKWRVLTPLARESLFDRLERWPGVIESEKDSIAHQLLTTIVSLHSKNILHKDLKTANVLLTGQKAFISDFDTASKEAEDKATHNFLGTLTYLPPEHLDEFQKPKIDRQFKSTKAADIWSMGIILYRLYMDAEPRWVNYENDAASIRQTLDSLRPFWHLHLELLEEKLKKNKVTNWKEKAELIFKMLQLDPKERMSTTQIDKCLHFFRNK